MTTLRVGHNQGLLADIGRKLVTGHVKHLTTQLGHNECAILGVTMLQNKLDDIVLEDVTVRFGTP